MADTLGPTTKTPAQRMLRKEDQLKRLKKKGWKPPPKGKRRAPN